MNVVQVSLEIRIVADGMLPEASLPNASLAASVSRTRKASFPPARLKEVSREFSFDSKPPRRIVVVSRRKSPQRVQVFWEEHDADDLKGATGPNGLKGFPKTASRQLLGQEGTAMMRDDSEEKSAARHIESAIAWHGEEFR